MSRAHLDAIWLFVHSQIFNLHTFHDELAETFSMARSRMEQQNMLDTLSKEDKNNPIVEHLLKEYKKAVKEVVT